MIKIKDNNVLESDKNFATLANSRFAFTDMTDYEYDFPAFNEVENLDFEDIGALTPVMEEKWP
jgi:hypothetical protein